MIFNIGTKSEKSEQVKVSVAVNIGKGRIVNTGHKDSDFTGVIKRFQQISYKFEFQGVVRNVLKYANTPRSIGENIRFPVTVEVGCDYPVMKVRKQLGILSSMGVINAARGSIVYKSQFPVSVPVKDQKIIGSVEVQVDGTKLAGV
jgi:hypothetical protein